MRNGKRILSLALLVLLVVLLMPVAAHADPPKGDTHLHSWTVISKTDPTCTTPGTITWQCSACKDTYTEQTSPALGHDFGNGQVTREATCTKEGEKTWTCSRCGATKTDTFPAKGHSPVSIPAVAATCTATGLTEGSQCSVCKEILKAQETVPATGHAWSDWATQIEATCTDGGIEIRSCRSCGTEETRSTEALGHVPATLPAVEATCEVDGLTEGEACSRCGAVLKAQEVLPAIGHAWDEGKVTTEPSGFTPGVRTFTCQHDPSHTRTEEIDPSPWLFASFTGSFPDFTTFDLATKDLTPLTITEQPVGGSITRWEDESVHLTCAASGGTGDYTYEWYSKRTKALTKWNWAFSYGEQTEPGFDAETGDRTYWCVVTDSAGNTAATDKVDITYKIRIADQPDNVNLQSETTDFYCEAADGSGDYTYRWYDSEMGILGEGQSLPATEPGICYCYCIVTDNVTGETATSEYCEVYSTEPFHLVNITESCEVLPEEETFVVASFAGGVEDYEIWWDKNGTAIDSVEGRDEVDHVYSRANVDGPGVYTVHGVDSMYATASGTVTVSVPKLTIVEQPVGGTIPKDGYLPISVTVADGEAPYTYTLVRNGKNEIFATHDEPTGGFRIWYPGNYYFHIEDSKGRSADSDVVTCENAVFRIKDQTESASLAKPGDTASLFVEAEGGIEPYAYLWSLKIGNTRYKVAESRTVTADKPGEYLCRVVDTDGEMIHSKTILVGYTGDTPIITKQPVGGNLVYGGSVYLSCAAVSGSGGELRYEWERSTTAEGSRPSWGKASRSGGSTWYMEASAAGAYHCRVTDTKTGKYTFTQTVFVTRELSATAEGHTYSLQPSEYFYTLHIQGGAAPYTVKVYLITERSEFNPKTILWRTHTVATDEEALNFAEQIPRYWNYSYYYAPDNEWIRAFESTKAFAIITDAEGKTTRVDIR